LKILAGHGDTCHPSTGDAKSQGNPKLQTSRDYISQKRKVLVGLGFFTQGFTLAEQVLWCLPRLQTIFALVILKMASLELFVQGGLESQSSGCQPPK
jgi:hypothetical protein